MSLISVMECAQFRSWITAKISKSGLKWCWLHTEAEIVHLYGLKGVSVKGA